MPDRIPARESGKRLAIASTVCESVGHPLVRFARRYSSWEPGTSDDDLIDTEFRERNRAQPDLRPSVYEIEQRDLVRTFAEHATAFEPPATAAGVDLGGTGRAVRKTPGDTGFSFTMNAHRELVLQSREDLLQLLRHVRASLAQRTQEVSRDDRLEYVRMRLAANDEEWHRARGDGGAKKWLRKIGA